MAETLVASVRSKEPLRALSDIASLQAALETEAEIQVRRARNQGYSWEAIAWALGVSKQAVHKKYAGRKGLRRVRRRST
jgi:hypothetical protein